MKHNPYPYDQFSTDDVRDTQPAMKVGILATVTPQGAPHLTLISTLMACSDSHLAWGQFMEGMSKEHVKSNPKSGFLIMTLDKMMWRGKTDYSHSLRQGKEYDFFNNTPMFRYNAYFGIHTAHYMHLRCHSGRQALAMPRVIFAAIQSLAARKLFAGRRRGKPAMNPWTRAFFDKLDNLKFLAYIDSDGYPLIIPLIQAQSLDNEHLVFSVSAFGNELSRIPVNSRISLFAMSMSMEDVLVGGNYLGIKHFGIFPCGVMHIDWVYNPMPPAPMQIYPELPLTAVKDF